MADYSQMTNAELVERLTALETNPARASAPAGEELSRQRLRADTSLKELAATPRKHDPNFRQSRDVREDRGQRRMKTFAASRSGRA